MNEQYSLLGNPVTGVYLTPARAPQFIAGIIACIGPFVFGYCLGYSSPTLKQFETEQILITRAQQSWFGSLVTVGAIIGGPIAGVMVEKFGRKSTIMMSCVPFTLGWFVLVLGGAFPHTYQILYLARVLCGIGTGMISLSVPLYIGEIATKEVRGMLGAGFQLSVTVGVLCVYSLGLVLSWRWLAIFGSASSLLLVILMLFIPETPQWWLASGNKDAALSSLVWLRGPNVDVEIECQDIARNLEAQQGSFNFRELTNRGIYIPLILSLALMFFQQASGVNAIIFYGGSIFADTGFNKSNIAALIVAAVQVAATFVSCILMDKLGRRILLLLAGVFMCASATAFGVFYYIGSPSNLDWLPLVSLIVFIAFFSLGWGPIPWLILGEIFPDRVKGFASGAAAMFNWTLAFLVTNLFQTLEADITKYGTFWLFAGVCLLGVIFVAIFMPETKGKSLEEIQQHFQGAAPLSLNSDEPQYQPILEES